MKKRYYLLISLFVVFLVMSVFLLEILVPKRAQAADLDYVRKEIEKYSSLPDFIPPGPPFDARKCVQGKRIMSIPIASTIQFVKTIGDSVEDVAKQVGIEYVRWNNQGERSQWIDGINNAISRKFDLIELRCGLDPWVLQPQSQTARDAGIMVFVAHMGGIKQKVPPTITGRVVGPFEQAGRILADWAILKTEGKANVLVITSNMVISTEPMVDGIKDEFATRCPECKVKFVDAPVPEWSTRIQPAVQSAILADPDLNYILPIYDSMCQFVVPAVTLTNSGDRVKIATFNGTPFVLRMVQDGQVEMNIGENLDWIGRAIIDAEMRALCGLELVKDPHIPLYIFDKSNAHTAGRPPKTSVGYGMDYIIQYEKLWGLR
jgi:ribose transport system substrate-binding protein